MSAVQEIKKHIKPGRVYRRADLIRWSNAVDRHLKELQNDSTLQKLSGGLYYCPKYSTFGKTPPSQSELVKAFLKDDRFLLMSFSYYNSLGVGTTQLYNETLIYNHKRHGLFNLGGQAYKFVMKHHFPAKLYEEFLLVDLVDNIKKLAEDEEHVLKLVSYKAMQLNRELLLDAIEKYGSIHTKKFFKELLKASPKSHGQTILA